MESLATLPTLACLTQEKSVPCGSIQFSWPSYGIISEFTVNSKKHAPYAYVKSIGEASGIPGRSIRNDSENILIRLLKSNKQIPTAEWKDIRRSSSSVSPQVSTPVGSSSSRQSRRQMASVNETLDRVRGKIVSSTTVPTAAVPLYPVALSQNIRPHVVESRTTAGLSDSAAPTGISEMLRRRVAAAGVNRNYSDSSITGPASLKGSSMDIDFDSPASLNSDRPCTSLHSVSIPVEGACSSQFSPRGVTGHRKRTFTESQNKSGISTSAQLENVPRSVLTLTPPRLASPSTGTGVSALSTSFESWLLPELRAFCKKQHMSTVGNKATLLERVRRTSLQTSVRYEQPANPMI